MIFQATCSFMLDLISLKTTFSWTAIGYLLENSIGAFSVFVYSTDGQRFQ